MSRPARSGCGAAAASVNMWPASCYFGLFSNAGQRAASFWNRIDNAPGVALPHTSTLNNYQTRSGGVTSSRTPAIGDSVTFAARLGPKGSRWQLDAYGLIGPDFGIFKVEAATLTENADGTVNDLTAATYIDLTQDNDLYNAVLTDTTLVVAGLTITGADGAAFTTWTGGTFSANGGAGLWAFRFTVKSKRAASTSYKAALSECLLARQDVAFNIIG